MKADRKGLVAFLILVILLVVVMTIPAWADEGGGPEVLQPSFILMNGDEEVGLVYGFDLGWIIVDDDGNMIYTCGCSEGGELYDEPCPLPPTEEPDPTGTPVSTSTPEPTETPVPTEPPHCNQGRGNGDDGCSPGNSDNQHGPNDPQTGPRQ
jgi:hypothetical protein